MYSGSCFNGTPPAPALPAAAEAAAAPAMMIVGVVVTTLMGTGVLAVAGRFFTVVSFAKVEEDAIASGGDTVAGLC